MLYEWVAAYTVNGERKSKIIRAESSVAATLDLGMTIGREYATEPIIVVENVTLARTSL